MVHTGLPATISVRLTCINAAAGRAVMLIDSRGYPAEQASGSAVSVTSAETVDFHGRQIPGQAGHTREE